MTDAMTGTELVEHRRELLLELIDLCDRIYDRLRDDHPDSAALVQRQILHAYQLIDHIHHANKEAHDRAN